MHRLSFSPSGPLSILAVGAHADDVEIGAGGTILRLLTDHPDSTIQWIVLSASEARAAEARASAAVFSRQAARTDVLVANLPDGRLPAASTALKDLLESIKTRPIDLILAPHRMDAHQDHRVVAETVWQTFRHHLIAEYEIPKYEGDLGQPNLFVDLDEATCDQKITLLMDGYPTQADRTWWGPDTFRAILRLRGIEAATTYAEAFHCRKVLL